MKKNANELEFISQINRDGSGTTIVSEEKKKYLIENPFIKKFKLICLSLTEKTFIASNVNCYVVKLKNPSKK